MANNKLATFFNNVRETVEAAETPFAKMAVFILPIIAPLVPAVMTSMHMYQLMLEIFDFSWASGLSFFLSFTVGTVLEMLGYVGAITFIKSTFDLVRKGKDEYLLPFGLNGTAYMFYLVAMFMINIQLGKYFGVAPIVNSIVGLLSFITVPTGLLAATHLSSVEMKENDAELLRQNRDFKLRKQALKQGINIFSNEKVYEFDAASAKSKKSDWRLLTTKEKHEVQHVLSVKDILEKYHVSRATAYNWKNGKG